MLIRRMEKRPALRAIALTLALASAASAQEAPSEDDEGAECMPSRQAHECSDRCPNYDTCFVSDDGLLYYRVGEQRFDCDGLDCSGASETLGDYCCRRGEFAPDTDDDGGCTVAAGAPPACLGRGAVALGALAALAAWRKRRAGMASARQSD